MTKERLKTLLFHTIILLLDEKDMTIEEAEDMLKEEILISAEEYREVFNTLDF